jgi:hypothetical protein
VSVDETREEVSSPVEDGEGPGYPLGFRVPMQLAHQPLEFGVVVGRDPYNEWRFNATMTRAGDSSCLYTLGLGE